MSDGNKVSCILCQLSEETKITGALSTKDEITAHENCLLFSSGLFCRSSPQFDDLFGFSVEDVLIEVKRGSKLMCKRCKKRGATVGCEVKRCKRSYHYPCAVQEQARTVEDADTGEYALYCFKHYPQRENNNAINGHPSSFSKPKTSKNPTEAGSSKVYCPACEKTEENIRLESLSNSVAMVYCEKHAPASHNWRISSDSSTAGRPSAYSSDSNSSSSARRSFSKRRLSIRNREEGMPLKHKSKSCVIETDDSSNSACMEPIAELSIFAPLETDSDENANSAPEPQLIRKDTENPTGSASGNQLEAESTGENDDDETIIYSDAESESLLFLQSCSVPKAAVSTQTEPTLLPSGVKAEQEMSQRIDDGSSPEQSPDQHAAGPSVPQQSSGGPPPFPYHSSPKCSSSATSPAPPEPPPAPTPSNPLPPPSDPEPNIDATTFWKSCNMVGCTQAIFTGFINEMNDISSRIQSGQASHEDYNLALTAMTASGKLAELVAKQQEELQRKQMEMQKAAAAMEVIVSALK